MEYSKAPEQPQSSARLICHPHAMMSTGREPVTIRIAEQELAALRTAPRETTITKVNLSAFVYTLFHEDFSSLIG